MGVQLSRTKKDGNRHGHLSYPPYQYPPYPGYWPGPHMAVVPPGYVHPGFVPSTLPWPANQPTYKRRRKRTRRRSGRKRDRDQTMTGLPVGFVPNGFVPNNPSAPQPVIPTSMSRAASQGQPPPLFTPGPNNSQHLTSFPSPQIPAANVVPGASSSHGHGSNRRAPTPFVPRQPQDDEDDESDSDSNESADSAPVIPSTSRHRNRHRQTTSMPAPMLFQVPPYNPAPQRRPNPLPEPPKVLFERTPFKRLTDLPISGPPYVAAVNPALTALTTATATTLGPAVGDAGIAGIGAGGSGGTQKRRSGLMTRVFSRRSKAQQKMPENGSGFVSLMPVARVIPVAVVGSSSAAGGGAMQASTSAVPASASVPPAALSNNPSTSASTTTAAAATSTSPQPPLRYSNTGPYSALSVRSPHSITYQGKAYPTAMHLFHAMEFMDRFPETAEAIRQIPQTDLTGVFRATSRARDEGKGMLEWRRDPGVFLPAMEQVLYSKMEQHESVRRLLLDTGHAQLVFHDYTDSWWGDGDDGTGSNEMGQALMRVRDRLREQGYNS